MSNPVYMGPRYPDVVDDLIARAESAEAKLAVAKEALEEICAHLGSTFARVVSNDALTKIAGMP